MIRTERMAMCSLKPGRNDASFGLEKIRLAMFAGQFLPVEGFLLPPITIDIGSTEVGVVVQFM